MLNSIYSGMGSFGTRMQLWNCQSEIGMVESAIATEQQATVISRVFLEYIKPVIYILSAGYLCRNNLWRLASLKHQELKLYEQLQVDGRVNLKIAAFAPVVIGGVASLWFGFNCYFYNRCSSGDFGKILANMVLWLAEWGIKRQLGIQHQSLTIDHRHQLGPNDNVHALSWR